MLTVQYPEDEIHTLNDLKQIPIRASNGQHPTQLDSVADIKAVESPTEVDHYQLRRVVDVYVAPTKEDLGDLTTAIDGVVKQTDSFRRDSRRTSWLRAGHAIVIP